LEPATIGMALKPRATGEDDELGFEDEDEEGEKEGKAKPGAEGEGDEAGGDEDPGEAKAAKPAKSASASKQPPLAKLKEAVAQAGSESEGPRSRQGGQARSQGQAEARAGEEAGQGAPQEQGEEMIRIVTLNEFPPEVVDHVARRLNAAYGLGTEVEGDAELPEDALDEAQSAYDAPKLLGEIDDETQAYADDKILYLTTEPLTGPEGPMGKGPMD